MSDRANDQMGDQGLEREIRNFLAWQAQDVAGAPSATEIAGRISPRFATGPLGLRLAPQFVWVLLALLLMLALIGTAVVGARLLTDNRGLVTMDGPSYEAVFLQLNVVDDAPVVAVVGVNSEGRERQIATLPGAWIAFNVNPESNPKFLAPMGAVSSTGLLAIPSNRDEQGFGMMRWEIISLHAQDDPRVIAPISPMFIEQLRATPSWHNVDPRGGVFWGPDERVAIAWYECVLDRSGGCPVDRQLAFVDGRTAVATSIDTSEDMVVLPSWASDGSGVFVRTDSQDTERKLLTPDGSLIDGTESTGQSACRTRFDSGADIAAGVDGALLRTNPDGTSEVRVPPGMAFACLAPDDSMIVHGTDSYLEPNARLVDTDTGTQFDIEGSFAGWLEVDR